MVRGTFYTCPPPPLAGVDVLQGEMGRLLVDVCCSAGNAAENAAA